MTSTLDPDFVALLANPLEEDRPPLRQDGNWLVCTKTGVRFPIVDGIPHLLPENAVLPEEAK